MSALALLFRPEGPVGSPDELSPVMDRLAHRGPDGRDARPFPGGVLGHHRFWTTPEEVGERQPLTDAGGRFVLAFDGRLDSRDDLARALGLSPPEAARRSDAGLVLAAWERWQDACLERLLGPFALIVVDRFQRRVVCARDALGDRTLFYARRGDLLVAASEEPAVLAHPDVPEDWNEASLAAFFAVSAPAPGETFFRAVSELPPGSALTYDRHGLSIRRHWHPEVFRENLAERSAEERTERFAETLRAAVVARLRSSTPVAVSMSGGLDSTSVAAFAARELAAPLTTISWVFDQLTSCDERAYMDPVVERWGLDAVRFAGDDFPPSLDASGPGAGSPFANPYRRLKERAYREATGRGHRVLLTGTFGDHLYTGGYARLTEHLSRRRFSALAGGAWGAWKARGLKDPTIRHLVRHLARTAGLDGALDRLRGTAAPGGPPPWLTGWAASRFPECDASQWTPPGARPRQALALLGPLSALSARAELVSAQGAGVDLRHPYRDRRLVELALALPAEDLYDGRRWKPILRRATAGLLPDAVRGRRHPTSLKPLLLRGLAETERTTVSKLLWHPDALWRRFVRPKHVEAAWNDLCDPARAELDGPRYVLPWQCLAAEIWRQRQENWNSSRTDRPQLPTAVGG